MPLQATSGAASYDAFGGGAAAVPNYIEEVFSTWLYTGTGSAQTITNGIDLSTKGGLVWLKGRSNTTSHALYDTVRGVTKAFRTNTTQEQSTELTGLNAFNTNGFGFAGSNTEANFSGYTYASWTFRKQAKFFDVFTYTGNGTTKTISHSLGSVPGCIIVKRIASSSGWYFYHRSLAANNSMELQSLSSAGLTNNFANVTSTSFDVTSSSDTNENNQTYIAYVFAHNAGGFGLTGTDNVISCGSYTGNSGSQTITLGYEPQWLLVKAATGTFSDSGEWLLIDTMRGASYSSNVLRLKANTADPEGAESGAFVKPVATGFGLETGASTNINRTGITYIYIAIRRGPMKVPTSGTSVFAPFSNTTASPRTLTTNFVSDLAIQYTGTGANRTIAHNLTVVPQLIIVKRRNVAANWDTYSATLANTEYVVLNTNAAKATGATRWNSTTPTSSVFSVGTSTTTNASGGTYVAYLFATCAGVSKVGSYTGNGSTQTIDCGFTSGARFVLIKRTDSTGDWYTYDTARGMTALTDPYLLLNSTAAEVATLGSVTTVSTGFALNAAITAAINTNAASYIFLAIA